METSIFNKKKMNSLTNSTMVMRLLCICAHVSFRKINRELVVRSSAFIAFFILRANNIIQI
jgi:hypothetical protein